MQLTELAAESGLDWSDWSRSSELPRLVLAGTGTDRWTWQLLSEIRADAEAQELIRSCFQPVLVEIDARPALAARLQEVLQLRAEATGFPVIAFATPDGDLFGAVPWRPVRDRNGQVGLVHFLLQVAEAWRHQPDDVRADARALTEQCDVVGRVPAAPASLAAVDAMVIGYGDPVLGGFGGSPKYPQPVLLDYLLTRLGQVDTGGEGCRAGARSDWREHLRRSLHALIAGGVHDHIGGGFFRASMDGDWLEAEYDKRAVDQAALAVVLQEASTRLGETLYRDIAARCLDCCLEELRLPDGWFAVGRHTVGDDGKGRLAPGNHYQWARHQLDDILGAEGGAIVAKRFFPAEFIPGHRLVPAVHAAVGADAQRRLPELCARLLMARRERPAPWRDVRVLPHVQAMLVWAMDLVGGSYAGIAEQLRPRLGELFDSASPTLDLAWLARAGEPELRAKALEATLVRLGAHGLRLHDEPGLQPPAHAGLDDRGQASALAVAVDALRENHRVAQAQQLCARHQGLLAAAPVACAGLAAAWSRTTG